MQVIKILLVFLIVCLVTGCGSEPRGAKLIKNFQDHRKEFEALRAMIAHDKGLLRVDDDWTDPADPKTVGVTPERIAKYRAIFRRLGVPRGFYCLSGGSIELLAYSQGIFTSGSSKSYSWLASPPFGIVPDIDDMRAKQLAGKASSWEIYHSAYQHIDANWYIHRYGD